MSTRRRIRRSALEKTLQQIAHDFNNVLAAILGTTDLLRLRLKNAEHAREDVDEIRKATDRGIKLNAQLSRVSQRITTGKKRPAKSRPKAK